MRIADPCPHCGRLYTKIDRLVRGTEGPLKAHDIEDHSCPAFRREIALSAGPSDVSFASGNTKDGLARWQHWMERNYRG